MMLIFLESIGSKESCQLERSWTRRYWQLYLRNIGLVGTVYQQGKQVKLQKENQKLREQNEEFQRQIRQLD